MPVIQVKADLSFDQIVNVVRQLSAADQEKLLSQSIAIRPIYNEHRLAEAEADLLMKINQGVPDGVQQRYEALIEKRKASTLTAEEYRELLQLTDQIELLDARRLEYLTALARIRKKTIPVLMAELGIEPPFVDA